MSSLAITISRDVPVMDALQFMKQRNVRRLPVVDGEGKLLGIVSEKDLLRAAPSEATSLSIYEVTYLLNRLTVGRMRKIVALMLGLRIFLGMSRNVVTVEEDTPLERAARIMAERHPGGLPVVRDGKVVGIITETDLLLGFSAALGAFEPGVRLMLAAPDEPGVIAGVASKVQSPGGNIASLLVLRAPRPGDGYIVAKVRGVRPGELVGSLSPRKIRSPKQRQSALCLAISATIFRDGRITVLDVREMSEADLRWSCLRGWLPSPGWGEGGAKIPQGTAAAAEHGDTQLLFEFM